MQMPRKRHSEPPPEAAPAEPAFLTIDELAKRWKASRYTITKLIQANKLQAFRVGERNWRIRFDEVVRYETELQDAGKASVAS